MAAIGGLRLEILTPLPVTAPARFTVLQRPSLADRAVLFEPPRHEVAQIRTWDTVASSAAAAVRIRSYTALRRTIVLVDDGVTSLSCLICEVIPTLRPSPCVGGSAAGDQWLLDTTWLVLPE